MYWVSLASPDWPSLCRASKRGMTTRSSCTTMDAVMYGMTPSAKIDSWSMAPPEKRFTSPMKFSWEALPMVAMHLFTTL